MLIIYFLVACVFYLLSFVFIFLLSFKPKYKKSLKARFFLYKNPKLDDCDIHFHACSYGEINALKDIVLSLSKKYTVNITTITQTGYDNAKNLVKNVAFLPFEIFLPFWLFKSKVLVIFEAELWLFLVFFARKKGSKIILLNARISDRSLKRYERFSFFYKKIFSYIDEVYAQSEVDKTRLSLLGAKNIKVCGNLKLANKPSTSDISRPFKKLCVVASTHLNEEAGLLEGIFLNKKFDEYIIVVAPRHPERFGEVEKIVKDIAKKYQKNFLKYTEDNNGYLKCDVFLLDTLGKLCNFYSISSVVFMCGSFVDGIGGHNALEPAFFENKIISGRYFFNQKELYRYVENIYICDIEQVKNIDIDGVKIAVINAAHGNFNTDEIIKFIG